MISVSLPKISNHFENGNIFAFISICQFLYRITYGYIVSKIYYHTDRKVLIILPFATEMF